MPELLQTSQNYPKHPPEVSLNCFPYPHASRNDCGDLKKKARVLLRESVAAISGFRIVSAGSHTGEVGYIADKWTANE